MNQWHYIKAVSVPFCSSSTMWATWLEEKCSHYRTLRTVSWEGTEKVSHNYGDPSPKQTHAYRYSQLNSTCIYHRQINVQRSDVLIEFFHLVHQVALTDAEPLIHFALNCGAKGCPPIKTYTPQVSGSQKHLDVGCLFTHSVYYYTVGLCWYEVNLFKFIICFNVKCREWHKIWIDVMRT